MGSVKGEAESSMLLRVGELPEGGGASSSGEKPLSSAAIQVTENSYGEEDGISDSDVRV